MIQRGHSKIPVAQEQRVDCELNSGEPSSQKLVSGVNAPPFHPFSRGKCVIKSGLGMIYKT
jgi:hypothetical protein